MIERRSDRKTEAPARESSGWAVIVQDFLVDVLGMILPGLGFLFACIPAIVLPTIWLMATIDPTLFGASASPSNNTAGKHFLEYLGQYHLEIFLVTIGLSYVIGHILFRQDIKKPDQLSFIKAHTAHIPDTKKIYRAVLRLIGLEMRFPLVWKDYPSAAPALRKSGSKVHTIVEKSPKYIKKVLDVLRPEHKIVVEHIRNDTHQHFTMHIEGGGRFDGMARPHAGVDKDLASVSVEYPYHYLREALKERGFERLARYVPWSGFAGKNISERSKHRINIFKGVLEFCNVPAYHRIARNEAHVRLASSVWYAAHYIRRLALIGLIPAIVASAFFGRHSILVVTFLSLMSALSVQFAIENALHYQRCREIIYVLHMVSLASVQYSRIFAASGLGDEDHGGGRGDGDGAPRRPVSAPQVAS